MRCALCLRATIRSLSRERWDGARVCLGCIAGSIVVAERVEQRMADRVKYRMWRLGGPI